MNARGLRLRVSLWVAAILAGAAALAGTGFQVHRSRQLVRDLDVALKARADWVEGLARESAQARGFALFQEELEEHTDLGSEGRVVQILGESGEILFRSSNLGGHALPVSAARLARLGPCQWETETAGGPGGAPVRLVTQNGKERKGKGAGFFVQIGMPLDRVQASLARLRWLLFCTIPPGALVFGLGAWLLVDRALKPIDDIIRATARIEPGAPGQRLPVPRTADEIERLSEALNAMFEKLEAGFGQTRQFVADAAHELRTPLGILLGETDVALKAAAPDEPCRQVLESHREEILRLSGLVERLLFLSHADAGQWRWDARPVALKLLVAELADKARLLAGEKGVRVDLEATDEIAVQGDAARLRQLLLNLVDNAVKYSPPAGRVALSLRRENGNARIDVEDDGDGIPAEHRRRIFDRFYRVDKARERGRGGYGLGLSIARTIALGHGGTLDVHSRVGRGSRFTLLLPLSDPPSD